MENKPSSSPGKSQGQDIIGDPQLESTILAGRPRKPTKKTTGGRQGAGAARSETGKGEGAATAAPRRSQRVTKRIIHQDESPDDDSPPAPPSKKFKRSYVQGQVSARGSSLSQPGPSIGEYPLDLPTGQHSGTQYSAVTSQTTPLTTDSLLSRSGGSLGPRPLSRGDDPSPEFLLPLSAPHGAQKMSINEYIRQQQQTRGVRGSEQAGPSQRQYDSAFWQYSGSQPTPSRSPHPRFPHVPPDEIYQGSQQWLRPRHDPWDARQAEGREQVGPSGRYQSPTQGQGSHAIRQSQYQIRQYGSQYEQRMDVHSRGSKQVMSIDRQMQQQYRIPSPSGDHPPQRLGRPIIQAHKPSAIRDTQLQQQHQVQSQHVQRQQGDWGQRQPSELVSRFVTTGPPPVFFPDTPVTAQQVQREQIALQQQQYQLQPWVGLRGEGEPAEAGRLVSRGSRSGQGLSGEFSRQGSGMEQGVGSSRPEGELWAKGEREGHEGGQGELHDWWNEWRTLRMQTQRQRESRRFVYRPGHGKEERLWEGGSTLHSSAPSAPVNLMRNIGPGETWSEEASGVTDRRQMSGEVHSTGWLQQESMAQTKKSRRQSASDMLASVRHIETQLVGTNVTRATQSAVAYQDIQISPNIIPEPSRQIPIRFEISCDHTQRLSITSDEVSVLSLQEYIEIQMSYSATFLSLLQKEPDIHKISPVSQRIEKLSFEHRELLTHIGRLNSKLLRSQSTELTHELHAEIPRLLERAPFTSLDAAQIKQFYQAGQQYLQAISAPHRGRRVHISQTSQHSDIPSSSRNSPISTQSPATCGMSGPQRTPNQEYLEHEAHQEMVETCLRTFNSIQWAQLVASLHATLPNFDLITSAVSYLASQHFNYPPLDIAPHYPQHLPHDPMQPRQGMRVARGYQAEFEQQFSPAYLTSSITAPSTTQVEHGGAHGWRQPHRRPHDRSPSERGPGPAPGPP